MIKAVFFDFYNTLVRFDPPREELQAQACRDCGLEVDPQALRRSYWKADDFMSRENARVTISRRTDTERAEFWAQYEEILLRSVGLQVTREQAGCIFTRVWQIDRKLVLFDDVVPTLARLKERGLVLGVVSNLTRELAPLCVELGLSPYLDFCLASFEVGHEKPHAPIFLAALEQAGVAPQEALHVGDQPQADVLGARGVGIRPLLLDRDGVIEVDHDCPRIRTLTQVLDFL